MSDFVKAAARIEAYLSMLDKVEEIFTVDCDYDGAALTCAKKYVAVIAKQIEQDIDTLIKELD